MPYLSGSVIYSLRCSLLHKGNPNVDNVQLTRGNASLPIDHFVLKVERKKILTFTLIQAVFLTFLGSIDASVL